VCNVFCCRCGQELFRKVVAHQCVGRVWSRRHANRQHAAQVASVYDTVKQFNAVSYRVIATVVHQSLLSVAERASIIESWINIAQVLRRCLCASILLT